MLVSMCDTFRSLGTQAQGKIECGSVHREALDFKVLWCREAGKHPWPAGVERRHLQPSSKENFVEEMKPEYHNEVEVSEFN